MEEIELKAKGTYDPVEGKLNLTVYVDDMGINFAEIYQKAYDQASRDLKAKDEFFDSEKASILNMLSYVNEVDILDHFGTQGADLIYRIKKKFGS